LITISVKIAGSVQVAINTEEAESTRLLIAPAIPDKPECSGRSGTGPRPDEGFGGFMRI
jgi:hypothetical protein